MLTPELLSALRHAVEGFARFVFDPSSPKPSDPRDDIQAAKDAREAVGILTLEANDWKPDMTPEPDTDAELVPDSFWDGVPF